MNRQPLCGVLALLLVGGLQTVCAQGDDKVHEVGAGLKLTGQLGKVSAITYKVKLLAGKTYVIDMISPDQQALDPFLRLLDEKGKQLAEDDDGGEGLNARIIWKAGLAGVHRIVATSFGDGRGPFTLTVREAKAGEGAASKEGEAFRALLKKSTDMGGLRVKKHPKSGEYYHEVADEAKLQEAFAGSRALLTPQFREALIKFWEKADHHEEPAIVAMLRAHGKAMKDERALAYAAFYTAIADRRARRWPAALKNFGEATRLFEAQKDREMQATSLHETGRTFRDIEEDGQAIKHYQQALEIRRAIFPKNHRLIATTLNNIGVAYASQGQFDKAMEHHKEALAIRQKLHGDNAHPDTAWSMRNIGYVHHRKGEYRQALKLETQALEMRQIYFTKPHPQVADSLHGVGVLLNELGDFAKSLAHYERALDVWDKLGEPDGLDALQVRFDRAIVYGRQGRFGRALEEHEFVLKKQIEFFKTRRHPGVAASLAGIGNIHLDTGDYATALKAHEEALDIDQQFFTDIHDKVASDWNNVAVASKGLGEYVAAMEYHEKALAIWKKVLVRPHASMGYCLDNLAAIHAKIGHYAEAERAQKQALTIFLDVFDEEHPAVGTCLNGLGFNCERWGKYDDAVKNYQQSLRIAEKASGQLHQRATVLNNLGFVYRQRDDHAQALTHFLEARKLARQAFGDAHPMTAGLSSQIAWLHYEKGDYAQALANLDEALRSLVRPEAQKIPFSELALDHLNLTPTTANILGGRALAIETAAGASATAKQLRERLHDYELAASVTRQLRQGPVENLVSRLQLGMNTFELYPRWIGVCQRLHALERKPEYLRAAFRAAEMGTARLFTEDLSRSHAYARKARTDGFDAEVGQVLSNLQRCRQLIADENAKPLPERRAERVGFLMDERKRWDKKLHELFAGKDEPTRRAADFLFPDPCSLEEARAALGENEVMLQYVLGRDASFALVIDSSKAPGAGLAIHRLPPADVIADAVSPLVDMDTLTLPVRTRTLGAAAFDLLLGPLADQIQKKDLVVIPSGDLCYLPFEVLVQRSRDGASAFLVEKRRIRYAPSASILPLLNQWQKERPKPGLGMWAIGDPVYEPTDDRLPVKTDLDPASRQALQLYLGKSGQDASGKGLPRLKSSGQEIDKLRQLFGKNAEISTGFQATTATIKASSRSGRLAQARFVHFAVHGLLGQDETRQPALVMSLVGNSKDTGLLLADDVGSLKLNADLVVLSACQTGKGQHYNGEGVRGLARAFLYAGSKAVVCSLWSVDDQETSNLMVDFYQQMRKGRSAPEALREAQLAMIGAGKAPLFWAPFIVIGE
jgi:CHAT domain-containing protein/tetratricopeptide (TPR) repeat protein